MGKFSLENIIKERLKGHEVHVDKRELWKSLGIEEEEKDRKAIWFWWLAGLIGIAFVAGLWWFVQEGSPDHSLAQDIPVVEIDENIAKTGNETSNEISTTEKLATLIDQTKSSVTTSANDEGGEVDAYNKNESSYVDNQTSRQTLVPAQQTLNTQNKEWVQNSEISKVDNNISSTTAQNDNTRLESNQNEPIDVATIQNSPSLLSYNRNLENLELDRNPMIEPIAKIRKFELELFAGVGTMDRVLTSENSELNGFIALRDSSESLLEHITAGLSLKYNFSNGFYGKAGLAMNRWNEKYFYNIVSDTVETMVEVPDVIVIDLQGNSTTTFKEGIETSYNTTNWIRYNRLTQIDLPISLGYEYRVHRFSVFGEATAVVNLSQAFTGYLNTTEGIVSRNPEIFKPNIGINWAFNAGIGYGITPRLRARLSGRYYRLRSSVLETETEIDQRYSSMGLRLGIGYLF